MDTVASTTTLTDGELQRLYSWIDEIPLSRAKRHIGRDFADGVLTAEVVAPSNLATFRLPQAPQPHTFATGDLSSIVWAPAASSPAHVMSAWIHCTEGE